MTTIEKHTPGTPAWVDLMTTDPDAARRFYGALFDWSYETGTEDTGFYTMCRVRGENVAGMGKKPADNPMPSAWTLYYATADVDATCKAIQEAGGNVMMPPMDVMDQGRMAICVEPAGAVFGLWQPLKHTGARIIGEPGALAWNEVNTPDAARTRDFLVKVFGLRAEKLEGMEYFTLHTKVDGADFTAGGVLQMDDKWKGIPPHWSVYFEVKSTDAAAAKVAELGGKVQVPPFDTPYGRIAVLQDPQGALFSVVQPPAAS